MTIGPNEIVDSHMHVGVIGDRWPEYGRLSTWYRQQLTYKIFLLFVGLKESEASDTRLHETVMRVITTSGIDRVACLALDPVYDRNGNRREESSHVWVANEYVIKLRDDVGQKVLLGASVHPYRTDFNKKVGEYVNKEAVLLKWLPSAQQFSMGDPLIGERLKFLATAKGGKPLPLLLHCGPEYAIPTSDDRTWTQDFISWNFLDRIVSLFNRRNTPDVKGLERNLKSALDAGAVIIFAHSGLPYFSSSFMGNLIEHSDFGAVQDWLCANVGASYPGRCYADLSAMCTPTRKPFFPEIAKLPPEYLLFGSDFPTPAFELYTDAAERKEDFDAVMKGKFERAVIPEDNMLDVNYRQLSQAFPGHGLFTNFARRLA